MLLVMLCCVCLIVLMLIMFVCAARVSNTQHSFYRNPHRAPGGQNISFAGCYYGRSGQGRGWLLMTVIKYVLSGIN